MGKKITGKIQKHVMEKNVQLGNLKIAKLFVD